MPSLHAHARRAGWRAALALVVCMLAWRASGQAAAADAGGQSAAPATEQSTLGGLTTTANGTAAPAPQKQELLPDVVYQIHEWKSAQLEGYTPRMMRHKHHVKEQALKAAQAEALAAHQAAAKAELDAEYHAFQKRWGALYERFQAEERRIKAEQLASAQAQHSSDALENLRLLVEMRSKQVADYGIQEQMQQEPAAVNSQEGSICFVVRTYWGHGPQPLGSGALLRLLRNLQASPEKRWQALLVVLDGQPFTAVGEILLELADPRVTLHTHAVGPQFVAKTSHGMWNAAYNNALYNATDTAIGACAPTTRWVVVTNGDNEYDQNFLPMVRASPPTADILAFDFYSRYQRITGAPCDRFKARAPGAASWPPCKPNLLRFCHTDLAAVVYDWRRFRAEGRAFLKMDTAPVIAQQGLHDALMAEVLLIAGWRVHWVAPGRCLVAHSPSPQRCAVGGGVWDDSGQASFRDSGGRCISPAEAQSLMAGTPGLEVVRIELGHDTSSFVPPGSTEQRPLSIQCVRHPLGNTPHANRFYPPQCTPPDDWDEVFPDLPVQAASAFNTGSPAPTEAAPQQQAEAAAHTQQVYAAHAQDTASPGIAPAPASAEQHKLQDPHATEGAADGGSAGTISAAQPNAEGMQAAQHLSAPGGSEQLEQQQDARQAAGGEHLEL